MARPPALRKQGGGTEAEFRAQSNVEQALASVGTSIITNGTYIEGIFLANTGSVPVAHKLGRPWRGYIVCKNNANALVYDVENSGNDESKFITLTASAGTRVSLWVF